MVRGTSKGVWCDFARRGPLSICAVLGLALATVALAVEPRSGRRANDFGFPQVQLINQQIAQRWSESSLKPSDQATDAQWCRRLFLDVIGRIPTVAELREFVRQRDGDKKRQLVDQLLESEQYRDQFAMHWSTVWTNILIGRSGGTGGDNLTNRAGLRLYLHEAFRDGKPYDRMVHELVTATGTTVPGGEGFNGATNFLIAKIGDDEAVQATAMTAKVFLGLQVQCTQCHNHPFNDWKQRKFWELNAFFRQTRVQRRPLPGTDREETAELVDRDFPGEGSTPGDAEIYYELRNGELEVAYPVFVDGTAISRSGLIQDTRRRERLGQLIVNSPWLEQMMVNRMWSHFLGYGFTKPVDDLGPHNPPSHPQLLADLAQEFRQASFDNRALIRWITLSQPYALSSRTNSSNVDKDDPSLGEPAQFSRFYLRQMQAEQLYESLLVATKGDQADGSGAARQQEKNEWLRQFTVALGNDEGGEATTFNGTIPQALMMFNGAFIRQAVALEPGNVLRSVADSDLSPLEKINYLFEAGLARKATREEIVAANQLLVAREGNMAEAMQDLWWAVLNSNEFIMNH